MTTAEWLNELWLLDVWLAQNRLSVADHGLARRFAALVDRAEACGGRDVYLGAESALTLIDACNDPPDPTGWAAWRERAERVLAKADDTGGVM